MTIRLVVLDIDGVLTGGEAQTFDHRFLEGLARMNRKARHDSGRPLITLCTGRPAPYVEAMLQAIDGHLPGVYENGAGLYVPEGYRFLPHPELSPDRDWAAIRARLNQELVAKGVAYFQPGKEHSLTLFANDPEETHHLHQHVEAALGPLGAQVQLVYSTSCLNIIPAEVDKGKGVEFLASHTGFDLSEMLGVGDSDVDLPFLEIVGYSAATANAVPAIQACVQYVSPHPTSAGVSDILRHFQLLK